MATTAPHPIAITTGTDHLVIRVSGDLVADSTRALILREGSIPPVRYIPRDDIDMTRLQRTATTSHCPFKGDCSYYALAGTPGRDIAWSYEQPLPGVAQIAGHLAFYPGRTDPV